MSHPSIAACVSVCPNFDLLFTPFIRTCISAFIPNKCQGHETHDTKRCILSIQMVPRCQSHVLSSIHFEVEPSVLFNHPADFCLSLTAAQVWTWRARTPTS